MSEGGAVGAVGGAVIDRRGALAVALSSGFAGLSGLLVMLAAARFLPLADNDHFVVFWSALFAAYAVLGGVQQESTRAAASVVLEPARSHGRILPVAMVIGVLLAAVVAAASPWWRPTVMPAGTVTTVVVTVLSVAAYAGHLSAIGILSGRRSWHGSSALIAVEAAARLGLVVVALAVAPGLGGIEIAVAVPAVVWLVALPFPGVRPVLSARGDVSRTHLASQVVQAMGAGLGTAVLVVGFPAILRASTDAQTWAGHAPLALGISLTRAALLMPLNAFQGAATAYFLDPSRPRVRSLVRLTAVVLVGGLVLAGLAAAAGPPLLGLLRPEYVLPAWLLAALTAAAALMGLMTLYGAAVLAVGRHGAYAAGWLTATVVACSVLLIGLPLELGAVVALSVGPTCGIAVHLLALGRALRNPPPGLGLDPASA